MAKISDATLTEGRRLVVQSDLEGLRSWKTSHAPTLNEEVFEGSFKKLFEAGDTARALKFFNKAMDGYDPSIERAALAVRLMVPAFLFLGALGGILYLASVLIGR